MLGTATAARLAMTSSSVCLVEEADDVAEGASKGNAGIATTYYAPPGTIEAELIASPGTYDHKHVARIAGIPHCVAYGPGELELAHQPDEYCRVADIVNATKVLALATLDLMGIGR